MASNLCVHDVKQLYKVPGSGSDQNLIACSMHKTTVMTDVFCV